MSLRQNAALNTSSRKHRRKAAKLAKKNGASPASSNHDRNAAARAPLQRALDLRMEHRLDEAEAIYRDLLKTHSNLMQVQFGLATLLEKRKNYREAYQHYKLAVTLAPDDFTCWHRFAGCLNEVEEFEAAEVAIVRALKIRPDEPSLYIQLAKILDNMDESEKGLRAVEKALELEPENALHHFEKGRCLLALGEFDQARRAYEKAAELDPEFTEILYYQRSQMRDSFEDAEEVLKNLETTVNASDTTRDHKAFAHFTIGRIKESQKDLDGAFENYAKANATWHEDGSFDPDHVKTVINELVGAFTPEVFELHRSAGSASTVPVFIIGMPRSGTTLVEKIITSHPHAETAGELKKMGQLSRTLWRTRSEGLTYPRDIAMVDPERLTPFADQYLARLTRDCSDKTLKVIDKLPMNFYQLGLISILFPNASVIHCKRDPMDICLSCYFQNFKDAVEFSNDLESLGFYYRQYERLMAHWKDVVSVPMLDVQYEEVVANQEEMSRKIVDFIGLDWDDACLNFHETEGTVRTASQWQVRQPVYNSSVQRWRRYEKYLGPLRDALAEHAPTA